jgi:hypothetical protein
VLHLEEVEPEVPVGRDAQISLADGSEDGHLRDRVRIKVVKLHPIPNRQCS